MRNWIRNGTMHVSRGRALRWMAFCCFGFLLMNSLSAQEKKKSGKLEEGKGKRSAIEFTCVYFDGKPTEDLYYQHEEQFTKLQLPAGVRSKEYPIKRVEFFTLYRKVEVKEDEIPYRKVATVALSPSVRKYLFIVIPFERDGKLCYWIKALDDSVKAFPRGSFRFVNFTKADLKIAYGKNGSVLASGKEKVMKSAKGEKGGLEKLMIGSMKNKILYANRVFGQAQSRELVFIAPPRKAGTPVRTRFISQILGPPPPPQPDGSQAN